MGKFIMSYYCFLCCYLLTPVS